MMKDRVSIAIDGPAGAGKSSLAKKCAEEFGFIYADTGAIYRTVGLAAIQAGVNPKDAQAVRNILPTVKIDIGYSEDGEQRMFLDGADVSEKIRMPEISIAASDVSAHPEVREFLMQMQRRLAEENSVIMDGRDIGTVVLPKADLKIFLTASSEERAKRRVAQLEEKGVHSDFAEVLADIKYRDKQDTERAVAPLRQAEDAILLDTTDLNFEESFAALSQLIMERFYISSEQ